MDLVKRLLLSHFQELKLFHLNRNWELCHNSLKMPKNGLKKNHFFRQMLKISKKSYNFLKMPIFNICWFFGFFFQSIFGIFELGAQLSTFWLRWINYNFQNDWAMVILQNPFFPVCSHILHFQLANWTKWFL